MLVRSESHFSEIMWSSATGRITRWLRTPPDGMVYFDHAPGDWSEPVYFGSIPVDGGENAYWAETGEDAYWAEPQGDAVQPWSSNTDTPWSSNPDSLEALLDMARSAPFTSDAVLHEVKIAKSVSTCVTNSISGADACMIYMDQPVEVSHGMRISSNRLEWELPDAWHVLKRLPRGCEVSSAPFCVRGSVDMHLQFSPNGTKSSEFGCCTVQLIRGTENKSGIKFELILNGRSSGPKACLGRRYLTDYPVPFDDAEESASKRVVVSIVMLGVFS